MAAAKRTRSRLCGSRLSCFAIPSYLERGDIAHPIPARPDPRYARRRPGPLAPTGKIAAYFCPCLFVAFAPMLAIMRRLLAAAALAGALAPTRMNAQASPYLPLD